MLTHFTPQPRKVIGQTISTAAVEVGYGETKSAYRNALSGVILSSIPSITPIYSEKLIGNSIGTKSNIRTIPIKVGSQTYEIGPDVLSAIGGTINTGRNNGENFPETPEYEALVLGSIAAMKTSHIKHLILGLPVHNLQRFSEYLQKKFTGRFELNDYDVIIDKVSVLPQPAGTLIRIASINNAPLIQGINRLIIDPGYYSTDWIVADGFMVSEKRSSGIVSGVSHILNYACQLISNDLKWPFDRIERLGAALKNNTPLSVYSETLSNEQLWDYIKCCDPIIRECLKAINESVGKMDDIPEVTLTGGGAVFYERVCKEHYIGRKVTIIEDPTFANVIGFLLQGEI